MSGPSARERGPSGPATTGPIFRNELPRPAPELPRTVRTLNYLVGPSAFSDGQSAYNNGRSGHIAGRSAHIAGRSAYLTERSGTEFFNEDCYPNPQPSQLNFPSHYTVHQHHSTTSQTHGASTFRPRLESRKGMASLMSHIGKGMHHKTQTNGGKTTN
jgi:hypothetical protein